MVCPVIHYEAQTTAWHKIVSKCNRQSIMNIVGYIHYCINNVINVKNKTITSQFKPLKFSLHYFFIAEGTGKDAE